MRNLTAFVTAAVGLVMIAAAVEGQFRVPLPVWSRVVVGIGGLGLIAHDTTATVVGAVLSAAGLAAAHLVKPRDADAV